MGNKLSCSCSPLVKKAYKYDDVPLQQQKRGRDGHLLRLWAEVFHVSATSGAVRWQQVSEDLVPVNITCIQDSPECVFHITAYNSQVEKILDVRLHQPGTRLGQASECFVYWKDPHTGDTWGLNFTSPLDAKQFRELCSPSFKFARKASSSYSLRLTDGQKRGDRTPGGGAGATGGPAKKKASQSTPASPNRRARESGYNTNTEEPQCTCMTADNLHRQRNGRVRYTASATLPRSALRQDSSTANQSAYISAYPSTTSVNAIGQQQQRATSRAAANSSAQQQQGQQAQPGGQQRAAGGGPAGQQQANYRNAQYSRAQYAQSVRRSTDQSRSMDNAIYREQQYRQQQQQQRAGQRAGQAQHSAAQGQGHHGRPQTRADHHAMAGAGTNGQLDTVGQSRSKSTDDVRRCTGSAGQQSVGTGGGHGGGLAGTAMMGGGKSVSSTGTNTSMSQPTSRRQPEHQRNGGGGSGPSVGSMARPTSVPGWGSGMMTDNMATSGPSSGPGGGGAGTGSHRSYRGQAGNGAVTPTPSSSGDERAHMLNDKSATGSGKKERSQSPTIKILQEYESHLRNALAKGADADTYSLNTFETILSQSMENVVALMKEVQSEIEAIRREESHFRSTGDDIGGSCSPFSLHHHHHGRAASTTGRPHWARSYTLPSRGTSLPPCGLTGSSTGDLYGSTRKGSAPVLDTLSVDGMLPASCLRTQSSFESTDSKCYLTSSEMSDDERLSLTTAISDDDDHETRESPYRSKSGAAAAAFQCTGAVRKAGFLSVKKWILRKRHQIELARKRGWKGYWVCLKGTTLLFYPCDSRDGRAIENTPRHLIIIDGAIMQPIPEHPKRDNVFCLSTAFGDAYLFQAPCQVELDNWIGAIHNACGAAFARHRGKTGALHLLQDDISRLDRGIDSEAKLRHAAEIQTTGAIDGETRKVLHEQLRNHDENLEQFHCEQYRLRCYMASLQATELPNPKTLLAHVSKATKVTLNRLGVFTVSSLHAYICARSPSMLTNVISGRGSQRRRGGPFGGQGRPLSRGGSLGSRQGSQQRPGSATGERQLTLLLPPDHLTPYSVTVRGTETVEEILWSALGDKQLQPNDYFLRLRTVQENCEPYVPLRHETLDQFPEFEAIEVQAKVLYQVELTRMALDQLFGFSVEAELVENMADVHNQDELCVYVSRAEDMSLAGQQGLMKGDEILVINGAVVSDLDMMYIESVLQEEQSLCMVLRSCRTEPPELAIAVKSTDEYIESLVCPPPPSDGIISDEALDRLIVPSPWDSRAAVTRPSSALGQPGGYGPPATPLGTSVSGEQIAETLLKTAEQVTTEYCRLSAHTSSNQPPGAPSSASKGHPGHHGHSAAAKGGPSAAQPGLPGAGLLNHSNSALPGAAILSHPHHHHPQPQPQLLHQVSVHDEDNLCYIKRPPLSDAEKLRKVIRELLDTERTYVEHLNSLLEIYLEPMKQQNFLNTSDTQTLFGNIVEIVGFQRKFLASLELSVELEGSDFDRLEQCGQFKAILFALGNAFQGHAERFKLYSSFCASHSKAQKILHPSNLDSLNPALTEFLSVRSRGQHAYSLESYLIKPIQRILKYPLLLQQMKHLTAPASEEHRHLSQALKGMERVAEHINEMQRIHEEYGAIFDHLQRQHYKATRVLVELSPVELLYYGGIDWVNMAEFLGKIKKGLDLHAMCFVFKMAVVFLCKERIRQKKKLVGVTSKLSEVEIIRYQVLIPVTEVQVRASRDSSSSATSGSQSSATNGEVVTSGPSPAVPAATSGSSSSQFIWELIHLRCTQISGGSQRRTEKVYQLSNSTNDFRNSFLKTIRQTIRESVRNMAVPFTKPPSLSGRSTPCQTIARSGDITTTSASGTSGPISSTTTTTSTSVTAPSAGSSKQNESITQSTGAKVSGASSSSQASSTSGQTTATEKPAKQKPPPPPRAPTTTKTTSGPSQLPLPPPPCSQPSSPGGASDSSSHSHHGVSCGLCGADVGSTAATSEPGCSGPPQPAKSSMRSSSTGRPEPETSSESGSVAPVAGPSKGRVSALKKSSQSKEVSFDDDWNP